MSPCKSPAVDRPLAVPQAKPMNHEGFGSDSTRNEWLGVDLLEFLATTIDLRIVLFQVEPVSGSFWSGMAPIPMTEGRLGRISDSQ